MEDGRRSHLQKDVPHALLGHVERLPRVEDALVEGRKTVDVLSQECHVVNAVDEVFDATQNVSFPPNAPVGAATPPVCDTYSVGSTKPRSH